MKFMTTWSARPGTAQEAVDRFLAGHGEPLEGATLLGRWHAVDLSVGFSLVESSDPTALYRNAAQWADIMDLKTAVVLEDNAVGPILATVFKK
jgi:hypothetical protein